MTEHVDWERYDLRYLRRGRVAHLTQPGLYVAQSPLCGVQPGLFEYWLGSGSQDEYEKAAALPLCRHCVRIRDSIQAVFK